MHVGPSRYYRTFYVEIWSVRFMLMHADEPGPTLTERVSQKLTANMGPTQVAQGTQVNKPQKTSHLEQEICPHKYLLAA